jgi:four helix bundle protein
MRDYKKLDVWKKSHEMYLCVKRCIAIRFPGEEKYEMVSALNRTAISLPLNTVEGCGRYTDKYFAGFLHNSSGSVNETVCWYAAFEPGYITSAVYEIVNKMVNEVRTMLISLLKFLRSESPKPPTANR